MAHSHDIYCEPHQFQYSPILVRTHQYFNMLNHSNHPNGNHSIYANLWSREDMGKVQGENINTEGKDDNLEMDKVQG